MKILLHRDGKTYDVLEEPLPAGIERAGWMAGGLIEVYRTVRPAITPPPWPQRIAAWLAMVALVAVGVASIPLLAILSGFVLPLIWVGAFIWWLWNSKLRGLLRNSRR